MILAENYKQAGKINSKICTFDVRQRGISLLESLVILAIIGILTVIAIPNFTRADVQFQRQNVVRQLKANFERVRSDSIKRGAVTPDNMSKVVIISPTLYSVTLDSSLNGTIESGETHLISIPSSSGIKIVGNNLIFPISVTFDNHGQVKASNGGSADITPTFIVCQQNCTFLTADQTNSDALSISPIGSVALVKTGEIFLNPPIPTVTTVDTSAKIDSWAKVSN